MKEVTEGVHDEVMDFQLIKPKDVARMLSVSVPRVYNLAKSGDLPSVRLGNSVRFYPKDVMEFIKSRRRERK